MSFYVHVTDSVIKLLFFLFVLANCLKSSKHINVSTFATYISFTQSELLYGSLQANHHYFKGNDIDKTQYCGAMGINVFLHVKLIVCAIKR